MVAAELSQLRPAPLPRRMVRVCVLGVGYVGYAVASAFSRAGYQVYAVTRSEEHAVKLRKNEITAVKADLSDPESYEYCLEDCAIIVHCAADFTNLQEVDRTIVETINGVCYEEPGKTVILTSGLWAYGEPGDIIDESTPDDPPELIAFRSRHEESILRNEAISAAIVMRCGIAFGHSGSLTSVYFRQAITEGSVTFPGDGSNHMPMVHIEDLAQCFVRAAEANLTGPHVFCVSESNASVHEVIHGIAKVAGLSREDVSFSGEPDKDDFFAQCLCLDQKADASKAKMQLGWFPRHRPFCDDLERYFEAFKAHFAPEH